MAADAALAAYLRSLADQSAAALAAEDEASAVGLRHGALPRPLVFVRRGSSAAPVS